MEQESPSKKKWDERLKNLTPQDPTLPKAIIVDVDGTLALMNGRIPYVPEVAHTDMPNQAIVDLVKNYHEFAKIIIVTGRDDTPLARTVLEEWLEEFGISYDAIHMRSKDDYRKDAIVKKEIFKAHIEGKYAVEFVLDDRAAVVEMWRHELGLPCLQVYYGSF